MHVGDLPVTRFGHRHFWDRALSRRSVLVGAGAAGAATLLKPAAALAAADPAPRPIPGGIAVGGQGFHVNMPGPVVGDDPASIDDPATITDFDGTVAVAHLQGKGVGKDSSGETPLVFDADMRFMRGTYVAVDGRRRLGTFGFI